jgi:Cu2+-exporting ATPase
LLGLPFLVQLSWPYLREGWRNLFEDHEIKVGVLDAITMTGLILLGYDSLAALQIGVLTLGRKLVLKTRNGSEQSLTDAFGEQPRRVWVMTPNGQELEIPFDALKQGDRVIVRAGERIPADGCVAAGIATIDRRMLTGESQPVESGVGDEVFASTLVISGRIGVQVKKSGQETIAAQIAEILRRTASYQSSVQLRSQELADKVALPQVVLGAVALPVTGAQGALAVFMGSIADDVRLTGPLSVLNSLNLATHDSILIKDGRALELLSRVNTVVFDKTGTLTLEQPELGRIYVREGLDESQLLAYAASAEFRQTHPIGRAIVQEAQARRLDLSVGQDAHYQEGLGILVYLPDKQIHVGSARYMDMERIDIPADWRVLQADGQARGHSYVFVALDGRVAGLIELRPAIRPEVKQLVQQLKARCLTLYILSGDHQQVTAALAEQLGIEHYFAEVLPAGKAQIVERLQANGASICFVGDGINDAIALKKAHVSVSLRGASTVATDVASIVLLDGNLEKFGRLFDLADDLDARMKINLMASVVPGVLSIGSVFLFHIGVVPSFLIGVGGLAVGMANSVLPLLANGNGGKEVPEGYTAKVSGDISETCPSEHIFTLDGKGHRQFCGIPVQTGIPQKCRAT